MSKPEPTPPVSPVTSGDSLEFSLEQIHQSCRAPVVFLFVNAAFWLVAASVLALIAAIKLHKGSFLAGCPLMTYGRLQPVQTTMFLYGFACQAAFGIILWLLCRLGRTLLIGEKAVLIATKFWSLGLLIGVIGILLGDASGYQGFELPRYSAGILFAASVVIGASALFTFAARRVQALYVSQWLVFAAVLIFAWIFATALVLLHIAPVRGMMQVVVSSWFANSFFHLWLAPVGLAAIFYLVSKLSEKPLFNRGLALVGFWLLMIFAGWSGIAPGARLPAWLPSVSTVANVLLIVPALSFAANWYMTLRTKTGKCTDPVLRFTTFGGGAYVVAILLGALASIPFVSEQLEFSHFNTAVAQLGLYGFFAMAAFGAIYFIVPQLTAGTWCPNRMKAHLILSKVGISLVVLGMGVAGIRQANAVTGSVASVKAAVPFIGITTLGVLVLLAAHCVFLSNLLSLLFGCCCRWKKERSTR